MGASHNMTRQQFAGWILAIIPAVALLSSLCNLVVAIRHLVAGFLVSGEFTGIVISAAYAVCILYLAVRLIKNDSVCRLALIIYCVMFLSVAAAVPILELAMGPGHYASPTLIRPIAHPVAIHYALFCLIFLLLFGMPLWLLIRRPAAPLFVRARHDAA